MTAPDAPLSPRHQRCQRHHVGPSQGHRQNSSLCGPRGRQCHRLGEILDGLARLPIGKRRSRLEGKASQIFALLSWQIVTVPIAEVYGDLRAALLRQGLNLGDNDLWIAATGLSLGMTVVTRDQGFHQVPGLAIEDWTQ